VAMQRLSTTQARALKGLAESRRITLPSGQVEIRPPPARSGPFTGKDAPTWVALERFGYVERAGTSTIEAGSFRWRMPAYRLTAAGWEAARVLLEEKAS